MTLAGFAIGIAAAAAIGLGDYGWGLALLLASRLADGLDGAGKFMTDGQGLQERLHPAKPALSDIAKVAAADAAGVDADQRFAHTASGHGNLVKPDVSGSMHAGKLHQAPFPVSCGPIASGSAYYAFIGWIRSFAYECVSL